MSFGWGAVALGVWVVLAALLVWTFLDIRRSERLEDAMARHPSAEPWWMPEELVHLTPTVTDLTTGEVVPPQEVPYCACGDWILKPGHELPTGDGWLHTVDECYSRGAAG